MRCAARSPSTWSPTSVSTGSDHDESRARGDPNAAHDTRVDRRADRALRARGGAEGGAMGTERRQPPAPSLLRHPGSPDPEATADGVPRDVSAPGGRRGDLHRPRKGRVLRVRPNAKGLFVDVGTAAQTMLLAAHSLGLGAGVVTSFSQAAASAVLNVAEGLSPEMFVCLGHPAPTQPRGMASRGPVTWQSLTQWERFSSPG